MGLYVDNLPTAYNILSLFTTLKVGDILPLTCPAKRDTGGGMPRQVYFPFLIFLSFPLFFLILSFLSDLSKSLW